MFSMRVDDKLSVVFMHHSFKKQFYRLYQTNKLQLLKWYNWPNDCKSEEYFLNLITTALHDYAQGSTLQCAISYEGQLIGYIGLTEISHKLAKAQLNYWIDEQYQGRGLMEKVCRTMIDYAFDFVYLEKIEMSIATGNINSRKVCEKLGFELEGIIRRADNINGHVLDHAKYGLLKHKTS